ncbi:MAG: AraC family transcriptional regulator [Cytophagaceae bacterium]|nr:MAG: AraC family transcriptional regulator [Cytophagaceae bacterium]
MDTQTIPVHTEFNTGDLKLRGFAVYEVDTTVSRVPTYSRRDFYKICLITGKTRIYYADRAVELDGTFLFFANPHIPYSSEVLTTKQTGYACLFTESFLKSHERSESLLQSPLFKIGELPAFLLEPEQAAFIGALFQKMMAEQNTDYAYKDELIRNYINLIIHETLKLKPSNSFVEHKNASSRITSLFLELLERQFPIESSERPLALRAAQDYAQRLSVHVNHLNRSVREITGKSTTTHISERVISEAKALLQHTDWSVGEVAYALGFEYPTYFNNYFKKHVQLSPTKFRAV